MSFFDGMKDRAVQALARKYFNETYGDFGNMTKLEIDSQARTIHAELDLKGEAQPIIVDVNSYELVQQAGKTFLRIGETNVSREWMNTAFQQLVRGREFEIPEVLRILL